MNVFLTPVLLALTVVAALRARRDGGVFRPLAVVLFVVAATSFAFPYLRGAPPPGKLDVQMDEIAGFRLGQEVAKIAPDGEILVMCWPGQSDGELRGLKKALPEPAYNVVADVPPERATTSLGSNEVMRVEMQLGGTPVSALAPTASRHTSARAMVVLLGLQGDVGSAGVSVPLFLGDRAQRTSVWRDAVKRGSVRGVVQEKPGDTWRVTEMLKEPLDKAFDMRFYLIRPGEG